MLFGYNYIVSSGKVPLPGWGLGSEESRPGPMCMGDIMQEQGEVEVEEEVEEIDENEEEEEGQGEEDGGRGRERTRKMIQEEIAERESRET